MLITQLKAKETITSLTAGKKVFIINCHGCKEVRFPEKEAVELQKELAAEGTVTGIMTTDYICNPENLELRLKKHMSTHMFLKAKFQIFRITNVIRCHDSCYRSLSSKLFLKFNSFFFRKTNFFTSVAVNDKNFLSSCQ